MKTKRATTKVGAGGSLGALFCVVAAIFLHNPQIGGDILNRSYDYLFAIRPTIPIDDAIVVYMDDESHSILGQPYNAAWDRSLHAKLINRLTEAQAKVIVYDVVFSDPGVPEQTAALAEAIKRNGSVILAADLSIEDQKTMHKQVRLPHETLIEDENDFGLDEMQPDQDFIIRRHFSRDLDNEVYSLSWTAATIVGAQITENKNAALGRRYVNYYGPPGHLPSVSFSKAIDDGPTGVPLSLFRGKAVFVGARIITHFSGQRKDEYRSPYSYWLRDSSYFMPGVDVHAIKYLNLVRGDWLERFETDTEFTILLLSGVLFGFFLTQFRPMAAATMGVVSSVGVATLAYYLFTRASLWFPWILVSAIQIPIATVWSVVFNSVQVFVQKRLMEQSLAMYVSPAVAREISRNPEMLKPGARKQILSVLFSDIANFTTMSEGMDPDALAALMNSYFEGAVNDCVQKTDGTVVKFIGDAIFAVWNAPLAQEDHRERACRGALLLRDKVTDFDFKKPGLDELEVRTRIGLHCGEASVGNFGSSRRIDYTAFGENINLSSRMEGLNKYLGTSILATGDIFEPVQEKFAARCLGRFVLKGFNKSVQVYELMAPIEDAEAVSKARTTIAAFSHALGKFHQRDWAGARKGFEAILGQDPKDGPSKFYLKYLDEIASEPPGDDWEGEVELKEK